MKLAHVLGALAILVAACATALGGVQAAGPGVGETFRDCSRCPEMVVPAGEFMMGSPINEDRRDNDEGRCTACR